MVKYFIFTPFHCAVTSLPHPNHFYPHLQCTFIDKIPSQLLLSISLQVAAWLSGNVLVLINVVALSRARLVLGWVTVRGYAIFVFNQSYPGLLSLAIPPWVGTMSTGSGLGHR